MNRTVLSLDQTAHEAHATVGGKAAALAAFSTQRMQIPRGIVERRGGMLIHGAIIAREYGLPCVTGVPHATQHIQNGDFVTVDGYLAIVTVG